MDSILSDGQLMSRPVPWLWIALAGLLLLAPGLLGRLFVDVLEGITLLVVVLPLLLAGGGVIGWWWLRRNLITCSACGTTSLGQSQCPACGAPIQARQDPAGTSGSAGAGAHPGVDASDVTIDVVAQAVDEGGKR
jgi:hypothetical protein